MGNRMFLASIILLNYISLYTMELEWKFTPFSELVPELQNKVIKHVDDMSYIGQANKSSYAQVKKQQIAYIAKMHRMQDFTKVKLNIPPFVFFVNEFQYNPCCPNNTQYFPRVCAVDPNSRIFYKDSVIEKWNSANVRYPDTFRVDCRGDEYYSIKPSNLLIACLEQNESEVRRLVNMYPIKPEHVTKGDSKSEAYYEDKDTRFLFDQALNAAKMIPDNKIMPLLLAHCAE